MTFQVIEGGGAASASENNKSAITGQLPGQIEAERLRVAVRALVVPGVRLTVEQVFNKLVALRESGSDDGKWKLTSALAQIGICFRGAFEVRGQGDTVFVCNQKFLLEQYPDLSGLHPVAHPHLKIF